MGLVPVCKLFACGGVVVCVWCCQPPAAPPPGPFVKSSLTDRRFLSNSKKKWNSKQESCYLQWIVLLFDLLVLRCWIARGIWLFYPATDSLSICCFVYPSRPLWTLMFFFWRGAVLVFVLVRFPGRRFGRLGLPRCRYWSFLGVFFFLCIGCSYSIYLLFWSSSASFRISSFMSSRVLILDPLAVPSSASAALNLFEGYIRHTYGPQG